MRIALTGPMGSGKTTIASDLAVKLEQRGLRACVEPMAGPLKRFARQMGWDGRKDKRGRRLLQLLGTECGRKCISDNIWIEKWIESVRGWDGIIICDDVRFDNEAAVFDIVFKLPMRFDECNNRWQRFTKRLRYATGYVHKSEQGITLPAIEVPNGTVDEMSNWILNHVR